MQKIYNQTSSESDVSYLRRDTIKEEICFFSNSESKY